MDDESGGVFIAPDESIAPEAFRQWRNPRYGTNNPERMDNPFWKWLIKTRNIAHQTNEAFNGPSSSDSGPCWCFHRFGRSATRLQDGSTVFIAGEHEDYYDPDFCIYNDVVVQRPDGELEIYGYPREMFTPTDFHSATLAGNRIIIIGNLGYQEDRRTNVTSVYALDLNHFTINAIPCTGNAPGWIHRHHAIYQPQENTILITGGLVDTGDKDVPFRENLDDWKLHLTDWRWERITERRWPHWHLYRNDKKPLGVPSMRHLIFLQRLKDKQFLENSLHMLEKTLGFAPDTQLLSELYTPPCAHEAFPNPEEEFNIFRIKIHETTIRYIEDYRCIRIIVEGNELDSSTLTALTSDIVDKLTRLERSPCTLVAIQ